MGISLMFADGEQPTIELVRGSNRYIQELDIIASVATPDDRGITPVTQSGDLASLDWRGIHLVDEEWRPDSDGTFIRQRFYRGAKWMEQNSVIQIAQANDCGVTVGQQFVVHTGKNDKITGADDFAIRRLEARQITTGCTAVGDCSQATGHLAQALVQLRGALSPDKTKAIHPNTTRLLVHWTAQPQRVREVDVIQVPPRNDLGYGFVPKLEVLTPPANGSYYMPGETLTFRLKFYDAKGNNLYPDGNLPTYADMFFGADEAGLRYLDMTLNSQLYYALKHREGNLAIVMSGPSDRFHVSDTLTPGAEFFGQQATFASVANDGYSAVGTVWPNMGIILGGLMGDVAIWETPVPDTFSLTIPSDALPGTYLVSMKARRMFAGEALNRGDVVRIQVGQSTPTSWTATTGKCSDCHSGQMALSNLLHGIGDRESCFGCHSALDFEPDNRLDYRVHYIHSRSDRYPQNPNKCTTCHLTTPQGPALGYPGHTWPY